MDRLPDDRLELLLPALNEIVECINDGIVINAEGIANILAKVRCEQDTWAVDEIGLWVEILVQAQTITDETRIDNVRVELVNRGIPEFPAILALERLLRKPSDTTIEHPSRAGGKAAKQEIVLDRNSIDFGILKPGEGAIVRIMIKGGPVSVKKNSNRIRVMLIDQGNNIISMKVELSAGSEGERYDDKLILCTSSGDVPLPIRARWLSTKPSEPRAPDVRWDGIPLLSWCPVCAKKVGKKSLFYNKYSKEYECFSCKRIFPRNDSSVAASNKE